jgi:hypothetical protein
MYWLFAATRAVAGPSVESLAVSVPGGGLCPGERLELEVQAIDSGGRARPVRLGRKAEVTLEWELGAVGPRGVLEMPADPRVGWGKAGKLVAAWSADPSVRVERMVPLRFDCSVVMDFSGSEGVNGPSGQDGMDSPSRGGDGTQGEPGGEGGRGAEVHVRVTLVAEPRTGAEILQIEAQELGKESRFAAISPEAGELVIQTNGGPGGPGGNGGAAGEGGQSGGGGRPGSGGPGGRGGTGGAVSVFADDSASGKLQVIVVENAGGPGGVGGGGGQLAVTSVANLRVSKLGQPGEPGPAGPPPEVHAARVEPLW